MNWAGITFVLLLLVSYAGHAVMHGKPRQPYDFRTATAGLILTLFLLWQAGWLA